MCRALQTHQSLCERLERTEEQGASEAKGGGGAQLKSEVKKSYKNVLRRFRNHPTDFDQIKQGLVKEMGESERLFFENLKTITGCALEGGERGEALFKVTSFQAPKSEVALDERIASVTKQISSVDAKIEDYKADIEDLKTPPVSEAPLTDEVHQKYSSTPEQTGLQQKLDQLTAQLNKLFLEDREKERDIQEGTDVVEGEIEYVIEGFDEKMEEMQADLEAREGELQRNEEELKSLQEVFTALEGEYNEVVAKRLQAEERMIEEREIKKLQTKAAVIVQAWWRGFCVRKAMKNKAKKKGKKGKGKRK
ncbi:dynein regulatory complex protein 10 [Eucyclogobius newberryi]|uniref:dynein regulatory complex protein 10 n=1 Tax=Eucyclogobius newberryi TaxID=166745 RepID=UPI003B58DF76